MDEARAEMVRSVLESVFKADIAIPVSEFKRASEDPIPTGLLAYDHGLLGIGGHARRHFTEISGKEGSGKTTLLIHVAAGAQEEGMTPLIIDGRGAVAADPDRCERIGMNTRYAYVLPINTAEDALQKAREALGKLAENNLPVAFFWDDMGLDPSEMELNPNKDDTGKDVKKIGDKASAVWRFCRALGAKCFDTDTPMCIVNQLTAVIETGWAAKFSEKETTSGGWGLKYAKRLAVELRRGAAIKIGKKQTGWTIYAKTSKNAFFPPGRVVKLHLDFVNGFLDQESIMLNALEAGLVKKERGKYRPKGVRGFKALRAEDWAYSDVAEMAVRMWPWIEEGTTAFVDGVDPDVPDEEADDDEYAEGF